ncbi:MAG: hypothetical protein KatS3mg031_1135 [Chitinophagales bacterium]|nr:MAG: hypothetical protein KatS3mg031_1135 [Chitinophagales bacterium]
MCGIFGIIKSEHASLKGRDFEEAFTRLIILSSSRGKEASGLALLSGDTIEVYKTPLHPDHFIQSSYYKNLCRNGRLAGAQVVIGHSRMVTNGTEYSNQNNQPFIRQGITGIHNGIIVNAREIWERHAEQKPLTELDSEVLPMLVRNAQDQGLPLGAAVAEAYREIYGMASIALLFHDFHNVILATNNGSLYVAVSEAGTEVLFGSEYYILQQLIKNKLSRYFREKSITGLEPGQLCSVHLQSLSVETTPLENAAQLNNIQQFNPPRIIRDVSDPVTPTRGRLIEKNIPTEFEQAYQKRAEMISRLKRCVKCLLPETFPSIHFDTHGLCNFCASYVPIKVKGPEALAAAARKMKNTGSRHDCLVSLSGGRDSCYSLHYIKKELGLSPLAFSYDWGMITDLARRNQSRMCARLGVEHILVSADIRKKRRNIRLNVLAWLRKPHLGTIPLFMAGDKQYFYYAHRIKKQNNISTTIMGENHLEKTGFKSLFSGANLEESGFMSYHISTANKLRMVAFYAREYLTNPAYLNISLLDTIGAFFSYYGMEHNYLNIFDYLRWDEQQIAQTLINEYDWETDPSTTTTWRIGDGTAAFYNYIYYMVAGFTENDTFRSNQIREGMITRQEALRRSIQENMPRWDSIQWYCNTIDIDWKETIRRINQIPTLYAQ